MISMMMGVVSDAQESLAREDEEEIPSFRQSMNPNNSSHVTSPQHVVEQEKQGDMKPSGLLLIAEDFKAEERQEQHPQQQQQKQQQQPILGEIAYQRDAEEAALVSCYERLRVQPAAELVLVNGERGTGKTRLVRTLRDRVEQDRGYFVTGKFDQLQRREPYPACVSAFTELVNIVLSRGEEEVSRMRDSIQTAIGDEVCVLIDMIPALAEIMGESTFCDRQAKSMDALQRFIFVFRMFLRASCSPEYPLVLVFEDLHYADPCSLDLLASVITDEKRDGLVVIGTCDGKNVSSDSYFAAKLRELEDSSHAQITPINLTNLEDSGVEQFIASALDHHNHDDPEALAALGQLVSIKTQGNPFRMVQFLRWLVESNLLTYDQNTGAWSWDEQGIRVSVQTKITSCGSHCLVLDNISRLDHQTQEVLKVASCLGYHVDESLLQLVFEFPVAPMIKTAIHENLLVVDEWRGGYAFAHDGIQAAAYKMISEENKALFHVEVGRRLWRNLDEDGLDRHIFLVLSQFHMGHHLITRDKEKHALATLCLHAGTKAALCSTFRTASLYLNLGIMLLGNRCWRDEYELSLRLYNAAAEMELCMANYERVYSLLDEVFKYARSDKDKLQAYATKVYALSVMGEQQKSIDVGIEVLASLGETIPRKLCKARLFLEMMQVKRMLRGKSNEELLRMPRCTDEGQLACQRILNLIFLSALCGRPALAPFIALKQTKLTLKYGLSVFSSLAFTQYAMFLVGGLGCIDDAFRFGALGIEVLELFDAKEYMARAYAAFYGVIWSWKKPIWGAIEPLRQAAQIGLQTGDFEFATLTRILHMMHMLDAGTPLDVVWREWELVQQSMISTKQQALLRMVLPTVKLVEIYMGVPTENGIDLDEFERTEAEQGNHLSSLSVQLIRMAAAYVFNDYENAERFWIGESKDLWMIPPTIEVANTAFVNCMVALAIARQGKKPRKYIGFTRRNLKKIRRWVRLSPHNFLDKLYLVEAELNSVLGNNEIAYEKFVSSIAMSRDSGFLFLQGLGNERAARHLWEIGDKDGAKPFFDKSCSVYDEWGAKAKLIQLRSQIQSMYSE